MSDPLPPRDPLTPREVQVAKAVARVGSYKAVGKLLGISPKTVEVHVLNAASKLPGVASPKVKLIIFTLELERRGD